MKEKLKGITQYLAIIGLFESDGVNTANVFIVKIGFFLSATYLQQYFKSLLKDIESDEY